LYVAALLMHHTWSPFRGCTGIEKSSNCSAHSL
jgi:hypothetical protein